MKALRLSGMSILGSTGRKKGEITVHAFPVAFIVDKAGAENARSLGARLLGAAEHVDPTGLEVVRKEGSAHG